MELNREAFDEYMRLSTELHEESVAWLAALTEEEFLKHLLFIMNDDGRSSMIVASIRESVGDRLEGMLR